MQAPLSSTPILLGWAAMLASEKKNKKVLKKKISSHFNTIISKFSAPILEHLQIF
jgi:hypothetical protein